MFQNKLDFHGSYQSGGPLFDLSTSRVEHDKVLSIQSPTFSHPLANTCPIHNLTKFLHLLFLPQSSARDSQSDGDSGYLSKIKVNSSVM